ncbi:MAG: hypothetical protein WAT39_01785 [Planctomycetota bacterium]
MRSVLLLSTLPVLAGLLPAQTSSAPCFDPDFGTAFGPADDLVFPAWPLATPFTAFGNVYTQIEISSNGFVWLGGFANPDNGCCSGTGAALAAGAARICAFWTDLVTDGVNGSGIYHASRPGREVITWANAFESYDPTIRFTVQLQLVGTGDFTVWFHPNTTIAQIPHTAVCGASPGGVANPGSVDLSVVMPYTSGAQPTVYEQWGTTTFDLAQRAIEFLPNGLGGWAVQARSWCPFVAGTWTSVGVGCPPQSGISGASFYETFTGASLDLDNLQFELVPNGSTGYLVQATSNSFFTGYSNVVAMGDDDVVPVVLPFPFVNPGGVCTVAGFCSNGFVWLDSLWVGAPAAPFVPAFLFEGPRIAALWTDLDLSAFGTAYYDATPTVVYFTWIDAADIGTPTLRSTFQIQLFASGAIKLCYQNLNVAANRPVLAGYGLGGATWDPGPVDLTASVPFVSGNGVLPVTLDWTGVPPVLGQPFPLQVGNLRPSALLGLLVLGFTPFNPGLPLAGIGMPNCFAYTSLDATLAFVPSAPATPLNLLVFPPNTQFLGLQLGAQAAILDPGITPANLSASNGGVITLGLY